MHPRWPSPTRRTRTLGPVGARRAAQLYADLLDAAGARQREHEQPAQLRRRGLKVDLAAAPARILARGRLAAQVDERLEDCARSG
jgi:hypothetical protein